jgi:hypothetical protein
LRVAAGDGAGLLDRAAGVDRPREADELRVRPGQRLAGRDVARGSGPVGDSRGAGDGEQCERARAEYRDAS